MALTEPWNEVLALHKEQAQCATDVAAIKQACAKDHDKAYALECSECWPKLVNRLRDLYANPSSEEWFSGRRAFLQELDGLFTKVQNTQDAIPDFEPIDQRIRKEKEDWFRDRAANLGLQSAAQSPADTRSVQATLQNGDLPIEQLVKELRGAFSAGSDSSNEQLFKDFFGRMEAAQSPKQRTDIYVDAVYQPQQDTANDKSEKYAKLVHGGATPGEVLSTLLRDRQSLQSEQEEKRRLQNQLAEFRRAKVAHQTVQDKRDKERQEKAKAAAEAAAAAAAAAAERDRLPPCAACSNTVDPQNFDMCPLCRVLADHEAVSTGPVVWCSERCRKQDFDTHVSTTHECATGEGCISVMDDDVDMDQDKRVIVFCRECMNDMKTLASTFCSPRCYEVNFQRHRDRAHLPERERSRRQVDDRGMLEFESRDEKRYRALKIEEHFVTLEEALAEYTSKSGATLS